jgi:hypothetical protein
MSNESASSPRDQVNPSCQVYPRRPRSHWGDTIDDARVTHLHILKSRCWELPIRRDT